MYKVNFSTWSTEKQMRENGHHYPAYPRPCSMSFWSKLCTFHRFILLLSLSQLPLNVWWQQMNNLLILDWDVLAILWQNYSFSELRLDIHYVCVCRTLGSATICGSGFQLQWRSRFYGVWKFYQTAKKFANVSPPSHNLSNYIVLGNLQCIF